MQQQPLLRATLAPVTLRHQLFFLHRGQGSVIYISIVTSYSTGNIYSDNSSFFITSSYTEIKPMCTHCFVHHRDTQRGFATESTARLPQRVTDRLSDSGQARCETHSDLQYATIQELSYSHCSSYTGSLQHPQCPVSTSSTSTCDRHQPPFGPVRALYH